MKKQIDHSDANQVFDSLKPSKKEQAVIWIMSPVIVLTSWAILIWICSQ
jgi:hypothetical protein